MGNADRQRLNQLRAMYPEQLAIAKNSFDDARLQELVWRYRARNFPQTLTEQELETWQAHCAACLFEGQGGARTVDQLFTEIDQLSETANERDQNILGALYDYAEHIAPER